MLAVDAEVVVVLVFASIVEAEGLRDAEFDLVVPVVAVLLSVVLATAHAAAATAGPKVDVA